MESNGNLNTLSVEQVENAQVETVANIATVDEVKEKIEIPGKEEKEEDVKKEETKEDLLFSKRFAALSRKEKAIRQREVELTAKMSELEAKMKALETPKVVEPPIEPLEYRLKKNPLKALEDAGLSYEKLTQLVLNDGKLPPESQMQLIKEELDNKYKVEIENLRKEIQDKENKKQKEHEEQVVTNFMNELKEFVDNNEEYELIKANDAIQTVYQVIETHYNKTGRILSNKEASDAVESHLVEEAKKLLKLKKLAQLSAKKEEIKPPTKPEQKLTTPSLTNAQSAVLSKGTGKKFISDEESKVQAASLIRWDD